MQKQSYRCVCSVSGQLEILKNTACLFGQALSVSARQRWFKFLTDGASVQIPRRVCPSLTSTARLKGNPG
jgi:hypothetical protein